MFNPETSTDTHSATSLQGLGVGLMHCSLQDGPQADVFGQQAFHVSPGVVPVKEKAQMMTAISGRLSTGSGKSVNLTNALANNLRTRLARDGSMPWRMTLKPKTTPFHRLYFEDVLLVHHSSERESFGLLPTVTAREGRDWSKAQILAKLDNGTGVAKRICNLSPKALTQNLISGLNPYFAAWMMGFPKSWISLNGLETPSSRKSPQSL